MKPLQLLEDVLVGVTVRADGEELGVNEGDLEVPERIGEPKRAR